MTGSSARGTPSHPHTTIALVPRSNEESDIPPPMLLTLFKINRISNIPKTLTETTPRLIYHPYQLYTDKRRKGEITKGL